MCMIYHEPGRGGAQHCLLCLCMAWVARGWQAGRMCGWKASGQLQASCVLTTLGTRHVHAAALPWLLHSPATAPGAAGGAPGCAAACRRPRPWPGCRPAPCHPRRPPAVRCRQGRGTGVSKHDLQGCGAAGSEPPWLCWAQSAQPCVAGKKLLRRRRRPAGTRLQAALHHAGEVQVVRDHAVHHRGPPELGACVTMGTRREQGGRPWMRVRRSATGR